MNLDDLPPPEVKWAGKYVRVLKRDKWEYASRTNNIGAVVVLAEFEGKVILVDQPRVAPDCRCVELPAGLVGDQDPNGISISHAGSPPNLSHEVALPVRWPPYRMSAA